jgi:hypothetical protein
VLFEVSSRFGAVHCDGESTVNYLAKILVYHIGAPTTGFAGLKSSPSTIIG